MWNAPKSRAGHDRKDVRQGSPRESHLDTHRTCACRSATGHAADLSPPADAGTAAPLVG